MYSDYCLGDGSKPNEIVSFTIMPYDDYPDIIKNRILSLSPTDIKKKRAVNPNFIAYLKEKRLLHINFILGSRKGLTQAEGFSEKDIVILSIDKTAKMLDEWCNNTPSEADYFKGIKKKLNKTKNELSKKSNNYILFRDVTLISLLAGYLTYMFTKIGKAKMFGWFSDRDRLVDAYNKLAADLFVINHHALCERDSIDSSITQIVFGVPETDGKVWYDEMNRLPDHIAGTLADWNIENNSTTKSKFISMLEDCIADNPYLIILRLVLEPNNFRCSRILVSRAT